MKQIDLTGINILQMQIFITAGNELNYTRAASICNVTQPTVSRSIDALEKILDLTLLTKRANRMQLTPAGKVIHSCFKEILCELYRNIQIAHEQQNVISSKLRITYPLYSSLSKPISLLAQSFQSQISNKDISVEFKNSGHMEGVQYLLEDKADILFAVDSIQEIADRYDELESCTIMQMPLTAYMLRTNPLSCKRALSFQDLENQKLIVQKRESDSYCARRLDACFSRAEYKPVISRYCDFTLEGALNLQADDEILIADRFALSFHPPQLICVDMKDADMKYIMMWRKEKAQSKAVADFVKYSEEYFNRIKYAIYE